MTFSSDFAKIRNKRPKGVCKIIQITATDLKANLGKYLSLVGREKIPITKNGRDIAVLSAPRENSAWVDDIVGIIPDYDIDIKNVKAERLAQKYESIDCVVAAKRKPKQSGLHCHQK